MGNIKDTSLFSRLLFVPLHPVMSKREYIIFEIELLGIA